MPKIGRFASAEAENAFHRAYDTIADTWPVPSTSFDVETSFGTTFVRRSGTGTGAPIVLLPGISGSGLAWVPVIERLSRDRVVYTPDVIGWAGRCVQTAPLNDAADIARWMSELFDGLGEERVHLAGNSVGSWFAAVTAVHHSDRLASVTMFEPGGSTFTKPRWSMLFKFLVAGIRPTPERMRKFNRWLSPRLEWTDEQYALGLTGLKFKMGMPWERPLTDEELATLTAPLLVMYGAETVASDYRVGAARVRDHIPSAEIEIYPNVGHDLLWANPDEVVPRFLDFVGRHS